MSDKQLFFLFVFSIFLFNPAIGVIVFFMIALGKGLLGLNK